jgi:hypothetical protein
MKLTDQNRNSQNVSKPATGSSGTREQTTVAPTKGTPGSNPGTNPASGGHAQSDKSQNNRSMSGQEASRGDRATEAQKA